MNKNIRTLLVMGISFIISAFFIKNIFLSNSPRINPYTGTIMMAKISSYWVNTTRMLAIKNIFPTGSTNNRLPSVASKSINDALKANLSKMSRGVYAGERNGYKIYKFRPSEMEYIEKTFNVKGKEVKIKVPKDQAPPSQQVVEFLNK